MVQGQNRMGVKVGGAPSQLCPSFHLYYPQCFTWCRGKTWSF